jgi:hypothetical protein
MAAEQFGTVKRSKAVWRSLYVLLTIQIIFLAGFIPVSVTTMYLMGNYWYMIGVPYLLIWLGVGYLLNKWKCPACLRSFLKRGQFRWTLPRNLICVNCGMGLGDEKALDHSRSAAPWRGLHPGR